MGGAPAILVVDDDEDIRDIVAMALRAMGYTVETAADGVEAIDLLAGGLRPSLVLLDMMMPRMDGEAFVLALRRDPDVADVPVVLLSGHDAACQKAADLRASGCLVKPVELDDLVETVARIVTKE